MSHTDPCDALEGGECTCGERADTVARMTAPRTLADELRDCDCQGCFGVRQQAADALERKDGALRDLLRLAQIHNPETGHYAVMDPFLVAKNVRAALEGK
jgi:hypothetical protein